MHFLKESENILSNQETISNSNRTEIGKKQL